MSAVRYQVMPPLSAEEYQELHDSIKTQGVLEPIHVDEDGVVIDGHHRSKIATELGIPCPVITHDDLSESQKRSLAFTLNLARRHLSKEQRYALLTESQASEPILPDSEHARRVGVSPHTAKANREREGIPTRESVIADAIEDDPNASDREIARNLGVDHKTVGKLRSGEKVQNAKYPHPSPGFNPGDLDEINTTTEPPEPTQANTPDKQGDNLNNILDQLNMTLETLETLNLETANPHNKEAALKKIEQANRTLNNIKKRLR